MKSSVTKVWIKIRIRYRSTSLLPSLEVNIYSCHALYAVGLQLPLIAKPSWLHMYPRIAEGSGQVEWGGDLGESGDPTGAPDSKKKEHPLALHHSNPPDFDLIAFNHHISTRSSARESPREVRYPANPSRSDRLDLFACPRKRRADGSAPFATVRSNG